MVNLEGCRYRLFPGVALAAWMLLPPGPQWGGPLHPLPTAAAKATRSSLDAVTRPVEWSPRAVSIRVRPIVMTALAAFFARVPMALAFGRGSEANAPLGRAVIGGLRAGMLTTLFVVPALYSLVVGRAKIADSAAMPDAGGAAADATA